MKKIGWADGVSVFRETVVQLWTYFFDEIMRLLPMSSPLSFSFYSINQLPHMAPRLKHHAEGMCIKSRLMTRV